MLRLTRRIGRTFLSVFQLLLLNLAIFSSLSLCAANPISTLNRTITESNQLGTFSWYDFCASLLSELPNDDRDVELPYLFRQTTEAWVETYRLPKEFSSFSCKIIVEANTEQDCLGGFSTWEEIKAGIQYLLDVIRMYDLNDGAHTLFGHPGYFGHTDLKGILLSIRPIGMFSAKNGTSLVETPSTY